MRLSVALSAALCLAANLAYAQTEAPAPAAAAAETAPAVDPVAEMVKNTLAAFDELKATQAGNAEAGAAKSAACAACHGADGNSTVAIYPRLAGQHEAYIARQLTVFKTGARPNPIMQPFASMLSAQDMRDIGAHFAKSTPQAGMADDSKITRAGSPYLDQRVVDVGERIYRGGIADRQVPACMSCHGPSGRGIPGPTYPALGGQHAGYTAAVLNLFKATPADSPALGDANYAIMAKISARLSDEEILALSSYLQGLHEAAPGEHQKLAQP